MMKCSLDRLDCKYEFGIALNLVEQAYKRAEELSVDKSPYGFPNYPYVWRSMRQLNRIQLEMGRDDAGNHLVAIFTIHQQLFRVGATVHVAIYTADETLLELLRHAGMLEAADMATRFSVNTNYHVEATKHFRGALLRMTLGELPYFVSVPVDVPPPPNDDENVYIENDASNQ